MLRAAKQSLAALASAFGGGAFPRSPLPHRRRFCSALRLPGCCALLRFSPCRYAPPLRRSAPFPAPCGASVRCGASSLPPPWALGRGVGGAAAPPCAVFPPSLRPFPPCRRLVLAAARGRLCRPLVGLPPCGAPSSRPLRRCGGLGLLGAAAGGRGAAYVWRAPPCACVLCSALAFVPCSFRCGRFAVLLCPALVSLPTRCFFSQIRRLRPPRLRNGRGARLLLEKTGLFCRRHKGGGLVDRVMKDYATPQLLANYPCSLCPEGYPFIVVHANRCALASPPMPQELNKTAVYFVQFSDLNFRKASCFPSSLLNFTKYPFCTFPAT